MNEKRLNQAGSALTWRAIQLAGTKLVSFARLLILARLLVPEDFGLLAIAIRQAFFEDAGCHHNLSPGGRISSNPGGQR